MAPKSLLMDRDPGGSPRSAPHRAPSLTSCGGPAGNRVVWP